jgi:hypothetical protein
VVVCRALAIRQRGRARRNFMTWQLLILVLLLGFSAFYSGA